jgi:hypothetical protein
MYVLKNHIFLYNEILMILHKLMSIQYTIRALDARLQVVLIFPVRGSPSIQLSSKCMKTIYFDEIPLVCVLYVVSIRSVGAVTEFRVRGAPSRK